MIRLLLLPRKTITNSSIRRFCTPLPSLSIAQLKDKLQSYGLPTNDLFEKREFIERLQDHEEQPLDAEIVDDATVSSENEEELTGEQLNHFAQGNHDEKMAYNIATRKQLRSVQMRQI